MAIEYKTVETLSEIIGALQLRVEVFVIEQGGKPSWEPDDADKLSIHVIGIENGQIVATARFRESSSKIIKIERMAIKKDYRRKGIGKNLLEFMLTKIDQLRPDKIWVQSQLEAQDFYLKCGFKAVTKPYEIFGGMHVDLEYPMK